MHAAKRETEIILLSYFCPLAFQHPSMTKAAIIKTFVLFIGMFYTRVYVDKLTFITVW